MIKKVLIIGKANPSKHGDNDYICTIGYSLEDNEWLRIWRIKPEHRFHRWDIYELDLEKTSDKRQETHAIIHNTNPKKLKSLTKQDQGFFIRNHLNKSTNELDQLGRSCGFIKPKNISYEITKDLKCYMKYESGGCKHKHLIKDQGFNLFIEKNKNKGEDYLLNALKNWNIKFIMVGTHARFKNWLLIAIYWGKKYENYNMRIDQQWLR